MNGLFSNRYLYAILACLFLAAACTHFHFFRRRLRSANFCVIWSWKLVQIYSTPRCLKKNSIMLTSGFGARPAFGAMATTCMPTSSARSFRRTTCAGW